MSEVITYLMPIETTARELDYKLAIAARLKAPHRQFLLFRPDLADVLIRLVHAGVWVGQNIRARTPQGDDFSRYRALKDAAFAVAYIDEEGGIYPGDEDSWEQLIRQRLDPSVLAEDDLLVGWGSFQSAVWQRSPSSVRARILDTGHPRFDLYGRPLSAIYDSRAEALRKEHGPFVLINTNFATANFVTGLGGLFNRRDGYVADDVTKRIPFVEGWRRALLSLGEFVAMAHHLAARYPTLRFIVRPHPVEDHDVYRKVLAGVSNLSVQHEGSVVPWLRAATAVVHNGCTTAIESFLLGTPALAYCPPTIGDGESWVPNLFSTRAESLDELAALVGAASQGTPPTVTPEPAKRRRVTQLVAQLGEGQRPGAALDSVVAALERLEPALQARRPHFRARAARLVAEAHGAGTSAKSLARKARQVVRAPEVAPPKFRAFELADMGARTDALKRATGVALTADLLSTTACLVR